MERGPASGTDPEPASATAAHKPHPSLETPVTAVVTEAPDDDEDALLLEALGMSVRTAPAALSIGQVVDDAYRIDGVIGAGGMGRVYRARDLRLGRDVAIKLHAAVTVEPAGSRLLREATALARLAHPNVVTVFEVGTWAGHPWVAMEYVRGGTARTWLTQKPRTAREILALFGAAGRGLAAAHAAGLVHRDFKPDNVLVGDDGRVRVADFGLARETTPKDPALMSGKHAAPPTVDPGDDDHAPSMKTAVTRTGVVMGTPAYMAPEQHTGEAVGPAADQFAFAVAVWEAIAKARPFPGATATEIAQSCVRGALADPPPGRLPRHVEAALRRALALEPADRWPSMTALIDELARDPARKRKLVLGGAGAALAIAGAATIAGMTLGGGEPAVDCASAGARLAWSDAQHAAIRSGLLATKHATAADVDRALASLDGWAGAWRTQRVAACEATHVQRDQSPQLLDRRNHCLDRARSAFEATTSLLAAPTPAIADRAAELARKLPALDDCADVPSLDAGAPPPTDPVAIARSAEVEASLARAIALHTAGEGTGALAEAKRAVALADQLARPAIAARARLVQSGALFESGTVDGMLELTEAAGRLAAEGRDDTILARVWLHAIGVVSMRKGRPADADRLLAVADAAVVRAGSPPKLQLELIETRADVHAQRGEQGRALPLYKTALALHEQIYGPDDPNIARLLNQLASAQLGVNQREAALRDVDRAIRIVERGYGERNPHLAILLGTRGNVMMQLGNFEEAEASYRRALAILEATVGPDRITLATPLTNLANVMLEYGRTDDALPLVERALAITERALGPTHPRAAFAVTVAGSVYQQRGEWKQAIERYERAASIQRTVGELPPLDETMLKLATAYVAVQEFPKAYAAADRAIKISTASGDLQQLAKATMALGRIQLAQQLPESEQTLDKALDMLARSVGKDHPEYHRLLLQLQMFFPSTHPDPDNPFQRQRQP